ncbi:TB2/DP1, HVA22 family-domain-containing protein [Flammula alnicola]|nr:TB2/DP1, HVA22 family-domain-containing protein [Flammula alnicola]
MCIAMSPILPLLEHSSAVPFLKYIRVLFTMFMSTISRLLSAWFAFLLPCYATYKALSSRPLSEPDLHKWSMYWSVIGAFIAFEYVAEWMVSWLPFYWELKTLFLLYLSLPQTQVHRFVFLF